MRDNQGTYSLRGINMEIIIVSVIAAVFLLMASLWSDFATFLNFPIVTFFVVLIGIGVILFYIRYFAKKRRN